MSIWGVYGAEWDLNGVFDNSEPFQRAWINIKGKVNAGSNPSHVRFYQCCLFVAIFIADTNIIVSKDLTSVVSFLHAVLHFEHIVLILCVVGQKKINDFNIGFQVR